MKRVLITGWAGFIGSNLIRYLLKRTEWMMLGIDSETYAAQPDWALSARKAPRTRQRFTPVHIDICDEVAVRRIFKEFRPEIVIHLAAETHVCRSIDGPKAFVMTNVVGTFNLLQAAAHMPDRPIFHHVSTDEVFGELGDRGYFRETSRYRPRSPYAATKAASDHLVMSYHHSYGLDVRVSNCSNNFGPNQHEEKLIPKAILCALKGEEMTIYGSGYQIRDWIWVNDHCSGILKAITRGKPGGQYLFGGNCEATNIEIIDSVGRAVDWVLENQGKHPSAKKFRYTADRPTDDKRYAIDASKADKQLGWLPDPELFDSRLIDTVLWYQERMEQKHGE